MTFNIFRRDFRLPEYILIFGLYLIILGLFTMEFFHILSNLGIIIITLYALEYFIKSGQKISSLKSSNFLPFIIIFFLFLLNLIITHKANSRNIFHHLEKKIIFLILPFSFIVLPTFNRNVYRNVYLLFFLLTIATAIKCTIIYFIYKDEILEFYKASGIIPTPVNHIRYSLMVCYAIFIGSFLIYYKFVNSLLLKILIVAGMLFLIFFLHLLAVRSGLACFYALLFAIACYFLIKKNFILLFTVLASTLILIFISFRYIDTIAVKWGYTFYDINQYINDEDPSNLSLSKRIISNKVAFTVFTENPVLGAGIANIRSRMERVYKEEYPEIPKAKYIDPHNQYMEILSTTGIIGFILFFTCFYFPLFNKKNFRSFPLLAIYIILSLSFFVEDTLNTQLGFTFGLFFIFFNLHYTQTLNWNNDKNIRGNHNV